METDTLSSPIDSSIYFRTEVEGADKWYVIKHDDNCSPTTQRAVDGVPLFSIFPQAPKYQYLSSCAAVGSTIYVIGGADMEHPSSFSPTLLADVYCIDANDPRDGWKKASPMKKPRAFPHALTIKSDIYVIGSDYDDNDKSTPFAEVFVKQQNWRELKQVKDGPYMYAVFDGNDLYVLILLRGLGIGELYSFNVKTQSLEGNCFSCSRNLMNASAFVDGILYFLDYTDPGVLFGIDVSNPKSLQPMEVELLNDDNKSCNWNWIPQQTPHSVAPQGHLVSLENGKLAVVWAGKHFGSSTSGDKLSIYCSKMELNKFEAKPLSRSHHVVEGVALIDCLAVSWFDTTGGERKAAPASPGRMKKLASEKGRGTEKVSEDLHLRLPESVREGKQTASFDGKDEGVDEKVETFIDRFINRFKQLLKLRRLDLPESVREGKQTASFDGEDEGVDEKVETFINQFKQQLKLQRLDSIIRYNEMLGRGSGR